MTSRAPAKTLLAEIVAAHGGTERWQSLHGLEAQLSAWGLLFRAKRRPLINHQRVRVSTRQPHVWFDDYPKPGLTGELCGLEAVRIRDAAGAIVVQRTEPRAFFRSLRRQVSWDDLDLLYFAGYAFWNYLTVPFLFLRPGCALEALEPVRTTIGVWRRLRVGFPPDLPTHCPQQVFYFDGQGRLMRLDYTAEVVGRWARAVHTCDDHRWFEGLLVPTRRRVTLRVLGRALLGPTLVGITVHDVRAIPASNPQG